MIYTLLETGIAIVVIAFLCTQVLYPVFKGRLLFPMFRKEGKYEAIIRQRKQAQHEAELRRKSNLDFTKKE